MGCSLPGSTIPGIVQARILEWVAMPSSQPKEDPGVFPTQRLNPCLLVSPGLAGGVFTTSATWEAHYLGYSESKSSANVEPQRQVLCGCEMPFSSLPVLSIQTQVGRAQLWGANLAAGQWRCQPVVEQPSFTEIGCWFSLLLKSPGWRVFCFFFWHRHSSAFPNEAFCKYKSLPFYSFKGEPLKPPGTPCLWEFQAVPAFLCPDNMAFSRLGN